MSRLLLVRHGESEWNALGRWQGQADPPLSDHGRHQAAVAARHLGAIDLVVASTLQRAHHTASIVAEALGVGPVRSDARLIERDAGEWSGLTRDEIKSAWPGYLAENPEDRWIERRPPGWEPDSKLLVRAEAALADTIDGLGADDTALVVTHGGVIYALEARYGAPRRYLPNLAARWIDLTITDKGPSVTLGARVHLYDPGNDPDQFDATPPDPQAV
jgi:probable phosphoglycerate mutase